MNVCLVVLFVCLFVSCLLIVPGDEHNLFSFVERRESLSPIRLKVRGSQGSCWLVNTRRGWGRTPPWIQPSWTSVLARSFGRELSRGPFGGGRHVNADSCPQTTCEGSFRFIAILVRTCVILWVDKTPYQPG